MRLLAAAVSFAAISSPASADVAGELRMNYNSCVITLNIWQDATTKLPGTRHSIMENENYYSDPPPVAKH
ncbi:hypothetical protein AF71_00058550 [Rhizobium sp. 57MFTsu3.2]|nr:hypothetical protein [Rhizobium sp. 57MFTsu3.2]